MSKIVDAINSLEDLISTGAVTIEEIESAEQELGLKFSKEYKEYLGNFGSILADDIELTGVAKSKNRNVIAVTKREWELNPQIQHNVYAVENLAIDGIIIWQDENGIVYESTPNSAIRKIADSLSDYVLSKK